MKNKQIALILLSAFFCLASLHLLYADACKGCVSGGNCYDVGNILVLSGTSSYCDLSSKNFTAQKADNQSCTNDFECINGSCIDSKCTNLLILFNQYHVNLTNLNQGACDNGPGCLNDTMKNSTNMTGLSNSSKICMPSYVCYECDSKYFWNTTTASCAPHYCSSSPGCLNTSSLANSTILTDHYCDNNFNCFSCTSNHTWDGSTCRSNQSSVVPSGCPSGQTLVNGICAVISSCTSNTDCGANQNCVSGQCVQISCQPNCAGKQCGDDGCAGSCGTCMSNSTCSNNVCVPAQSGAGRSNLTMILLILGIVVVILAIAVIIWVYFWKTKQQSDKQLKVIRPNIPPNPPVQGRQYSLLFF